MKKSSGRNERWTELRLGQRVPNEEAESAKKVGTRPALETDRVRPLWTSECGPNGSRVKPIEDKQRGLIRVVDIGYNWTKQKKKASRSWQGSIRSHVSTRFQPHLRPRRWRSKWQPQVVFTDLEIPVQLDPSLTFPQGQGRLLWSEWHFQLTEKKSKWNRIKIQQISHNLT